MTETILAVVAHADDEVLGCGGTLARHAAAGDHVHVLILADGVSSRPGAGAVERAGREAAALAASRALGILPPVLLGLPDNRLDIVALLDVVQRIEAEMARLEPAVIYTHHGGDLNVDHRVVHQAVITACRPLAGRALRALYAFETPSSTEWASDADFRAFRPTRFVGIAPFLAAKLAALAAYEAECRPFPHPRSPRAITALAEWRGASAGFEAAEAFEILREVVA